MEGVRFPILVVVVIGFAGCSKAPDVPFPDWIGSVGTARAGSSDSRSAEFVAAAQDAERLAPEFLTRVSFTPNHKTTLIERLAAPAARALKASRESVSLSNRWSPPFEALDFQRGWRLIGRTLAWQVDRKVAVEDYPGAVQSMIDAARFGFALGTGSASDAALGLSVVDEARKAMAPSLGKLSPVDLRALGTGLESALKLRGSPKAMLANERGSMLAAVQRVQDAYREKKLGVLTDELGRGIEPAIDHLEGLRSESSAERAAYFDSFAEEAELWLDYYDAMLRKNARQRADIPLPPLAEERPWRRFSTHFFQTIEPVVRQREESICRVRLLALSALLLAETKANGMAPTTLVGLSNELTIDPYSGRSFLYRPEGARFLLYSVGADLRDDGGETDETFRTPDIRVEFEGS